MKLAVIETWKKLLPKIEDLSQKRWFYPLFLLLIGCTAYVIQLGSLGFYWDDWEVVFLLHARNTALLYGYFAFDRPFAWPYEVMNALFGLNPVAWHLVTLLLRCAGIFFFYLALRQIWPRLETYLRWLGVLLLVYPGFFQQSISTAYQRHFTAFFLFMLSIYLMVLAVRNPRRAWLLFPLSWIAAFAQIFTIEYFVGLELIRPAVLWLLASPSFEKPRWLTVRGPLLQWLPYLAIFGFYSWWRLVIFPLGIGRLNYAGDFKMFEDFHASLVGGVLTLFTRASLDLLYSTLQVWLTGLTSQAGFTLQSKAAWLALGVAALVASLFALCQRVEWRQEHDAEQRPLPVFLLGLWAFATSSLTTWLTSKQLSGGGRWDDRFALATMFGAALMTLALVLWFIRPRLRTLVLALLLFSGVATQAFIANRYRLDWQAQRDYYWQLSWRAPALQPGTAIISFEQPSATIPGYDASFALNVLYGGPLTDGSVPYWFFTNDRFLSFQLVPGKPISYEDRNLKFRGSTSEAISVVRGGEQRCLQVLDAAYTGQPFYESDQEKLVAISNVKRILPDAGDHPPDRTIFGVEPPHTWCYYFEKADLARQLRDWKTIVKLEKEARGRGLKPGFGPQYVPFIEAHAQTGDWKSAYELSLAARSTVAEMEPLLCSTWTRLGKLPAADSAVVLKAKQTFSCTAP